MHAESVYENVLCAVRPLMLSMRWHSRSLEYCRWPSERCLELMRRGAPKDADQCCPAASDSTSGGVRAPRAETTNCRMQRTAFRLLVAM